MFTLRIATLSKMMSQLNDQIMHNISIKYFFHCTSSFFP